MITAGIKKLVLFSTRYAWQVVAIAIVLGLASGYYAARNFAISTDINKLISDNPPWRQRELAYDAAFPKRFQLVLAVVDAPTSELATQASAALTQRLSEQPQLFHSVNEVTGGSFFGRNAFLFLPTEQVAQLTHELTDAEPLIQVLASDPSLRGLTQSLSFVLTGAQTGQFHLDQAAGPLNRFSDTLEDVLAGRRATFSWQEMLKGRPAEPADLRRFIEIYPVLNYSALEPGKAATDAIRKAAADLELGSRYFARVRLTGPVPIADEEFATVRHGAVFNGIGTVIIVLGILWLALRSARTILAVFITLAVGLAVTAAVGLMIVGALNLISIAFAVLFVGIGVDFAIQYSVRYRSERFKNDNLQGALLSAAERVGAPLTLAAVATAAGFLSFLPTVYRGVSELGQIAGAGMIIAFIMSVTLLPALLMLLKPPGEKEPLGFSFLAPVDRFTERHRTAILIGTAIVVIAGLPLLYFLRFDFNPIHLRNPKVESIATFLDLRSDPALGANAIDVLAPSLAAAREQAQRLAKVPEVSHTMTLESFVPQDQQQKLPLIQAAAKEIGPDLEAPADPAPSDAENVAALKTSAAELQKAAGNGTGPGAVAAKRLAAAELKLANGTEAQRREAESVLVSPLKVSLQGLQMALQAAPVTEKGIPSEIREQWITPDGRARIEVFPKGDPNNNETIRNFARAVLAVEPNATGGPISILESGDTIVSAFIQAGIWALVSIAILLWITLRRATDVFLTLIPLLVAGVVTLEVCVLIGLPLNFANIIALPLLLGIGVAFKIYYIMAWRAGQTNLLQSSLTRAVLFSALTTATAFGSLWLSDHPGTSSMGKLLAISLMCTLAAAVLFQPILMGPPRNVRNP
ncbi:MAG TPA: MMPL family transporter [Xanthobacteraceae bacterium]|nr:MMPL family transporter [Xanthobacteraceae bacterium]